MPFGEATRSDSDSDLAEAEITRVASTPRPPCHQIWLMLIIPSLNPSTDQSSEMATHKLPHKCAAATHHPDRQSSCTASRRQYTSVNTCMYDRIMCGSGDDLTRRQAPRPKDRSRYTVGLEAPCTQHAMNAGTGTQGETGSLHAVCGA